MGKRWKDRLIIEDVVSPDEEHAFLEFRNAVIGHLPHGYFTHPDLRKVRPRGASNLLGTLFQIAKGSDEILTNATELAASCNYRTTPETIRKHLRALAEARFLNLETDGRELRITLDRSRFPVVEPGLP